ncbi:MAG: hypothetical protein ABI629_06195 [bacterium]
MRLPINVADQDPSLAVWWATRVECISALTRRHREGRLTTVAEQQARRRVAALAAAWSEVSPSEPLRQRAERLLGVHSLRAADAFRLAAALLCSRGDTSSHAIVSFDERLREAARREGFRLEPN